MRVRKKIISVIIISILCTSGISVLAATTNIFSDIPVGAWYESAVKSMKEKGILNGYENATFRPSNKVNRAELAFALDKFWNYLQHPQGNAAWKKFTNKTFRYTIAFPPTWKSKRFYDYLTGFQPPNMTGNNVKWAVIVIDDIAGALEEQIDKMGSEYGISCTVLKENININGVEALRVTARTTEKPAWIHTQIFVQLYGKIFIITNGAIPDSDFELFYNSFKIMPPPEKPSENPPGATPQSTESPSSFMPNYNVAIGETEPEF